MKSLLYNFLQVLPTSTIITLQIQLSKSEKFYRLKAATIMPI